MWDLLCLRTNSMEDLIVHLQKYGEGTKYQKVWARIQFNNIQKETISPEKQAIADEEVEQEIIKLKQSRQYQQEVEKLNEKWMKFYPYVQPPVGTVQYSQIYGLWKFKNDVAE